MKITAVETFSNKSIAIVKVRCEDGSEGVGQVAPYNADISAQILHRQVASYALGSAADDIEGIAERCIRGEHKFPGSYVCRALAGVDTALWDLRGKRAGKSVACLLGATKFRQAVYGSSMRRDITPVEEGERLARLQQERGFEGFKIRIAQKFGQDVDAWPGRTEEIIPRVRAALDPSAVILADANSGYSPKRAIEVGQLLEQHGYGHFEEPCPYMDLESTAEVSQALSIPVAMGEQETDICQFRRMVAMSALDVVQPDICYIGGLSRALVVARIAEAAGLACTPHAANRSLVTLFTMHMQAALPNAGPLMELSIEEAPWCDGLYQNDPYDVQDGCLTLPDAPGWGIEISPDWLAQSDRRISEL